MTALTPERRAELRAAAEKATPGPWRWEMNPKCHEARLCGGDPRGGYGAFDLTVMGFRRWGMSNAAPAFRDPRGVMRRADEFMVNAAGRDHHATWFRLLDQLDANHIAAADPSTVLALLDALDAAELNLRASVANIVAMNEEFAAKLGPLTARAEAAEADNRRLREIVSQCASALGNGAVAQTACSLEFLAEVPNEVRLVADELRRERDAAEARAKAAAADAKVLAAYLTGAVGLMEAVCRARGADDMELNPEGTLTLGSAKATLAAYRKERPADA